MKRLLWGLILTCQMGWSEPTRWSRWQFEPTPEHRQLQVLWREIPSRARGLQYHQGPELAGNFILEQWLQGGEVLNDDFMKAAGSAWYVVESLHYQRPKAFGVSLQAGRNPAREGLGIQFSYSSGGRSIVGESADLDFTWWEQGKPGQSVPILRFSYELSGDFEWLHSQGKSHWRQDLAALTSAEKLRAVAQQRRREWLRSFEVALQKGDIQKRVYGKYEGGGIPPSVSYQALSAAERETLLARQKMRALYYEQQVSEHYREMWQAYHALVPWKALFGGKS